MPDCMDANEQLTPEEMVQLIEACPPGPWPNGWAAWDNTIRMSLAARAYSLLRIVLPFLRRFGKVQQKLTFHRLRGSRRKIDRGSYQRSSYLRQTIRPT